MNRDEFLEQFSVMLQTDEQFCATTKLADIPQWDSLALLLISNLFTTEFDKTLTLQEAKEFKTIEDIMEKAGI